MLHKRLLTLPERRSCILLGPRQTGKSTLVGGILPRDVWSVDLLEHDTFLRFAREPGRFRREAEARIAAGATTIFVDEVQKLPELMDEAQALIERTRTRFILTAYRRLKSIAQEQHRTPTELVREAIVEYTERHGKRRLPRSLGCASIGAPNCNSAVSDPVLIARQWERPSGVRMDRGDPVDG
jgi:hypothetical protein